MWISKSEYEFLMQSRKKLKSEVIKLQKENQELKDDSGEAIIERLTKLAKMAKIDIHSKEYQDIMHRVFMDIGGRHSNVMKGYSQTSFLKDNPEELLKRLNAFQKEASVITRQLEGKKK